MIRITPIACAFVAVLCLNSCERVLNADVYDGKAGISISIAEDGTRGPVQNIMSLQASGFVVNAFLEAEKRSSEDSSDPHYLKNTVFTYSDSKWTAADATWRNQVQTNLWCHFPETLISGGGTRTINFPTTGSSMTDDEQKTITVNYTMPTPGTGSTHNDAAVMDDLLFAYATKKYDASASSPSASVTIKFDHILSAIMFTKGTVLSDYDIKSISLKNVMSEGTCTLTGSGTGTLGVVWSSLSDSKIYTQDVTLAGLDAKEMTEGSKIFWIIPQTPLETTAVNVVFTKDSEEIPIDILLGTATTWEYNKKYTYEISYDGIIAVASLTTGSVNYYNEKPGVWNENTDLDGYNQGKNGEWGVPTTVKVSDMPIKSTSW